MNIKKTNERKLLCLSALCEHEPWDNTCLYNKLIEKGSQALYDEMIKIIADEVKTAEAEIKAKYDKKVVKINKESERKKSGTRKKKPIQE